MNERYTARSFIVPRLSFYVMVVNSFGTLFSNAKKYSIFLPAHALGAFFWFGSAKRNFPMAHLIGKRSKSSAGA
jgi:hypothetical protein